MAKKTTPKTKDMSIDAGSGKIVSKDFADKNPKTTVTMKVPVGKKPKK